MARVLSDMFFAPASAESVQARLAASDMLTSGILDPIVGRYYDGAQSSGTTPGSFAVTANTIYGTAFRVGRRMSIDRLGVNRTAAAPATAGGIRVALYDADRNTGEPTVPILTPAEFPVAASAAAAGHEATVAQQFELGEMYWLMAWASQAYTLAQLATSAVPPFGGLQSLTATSYGQRIQRALAYTSTGAWPSPFGLAAADLGTAGAGVSVRVRCASVG